MSVMNQSRKLMSSNNRPLVTTACRTLPFIAIAALAISRPLPAFADAAGADACAKTLSPPAKMIYQATAPDIRQGVELKAVVTAQTRKLVMDGKIERSIARPSAVAAAACLKTLLE
jgi:hypothetical protein